MKHHIDSNHHVNNAQYAQIAREVLPDCFKIAELRIEYKKAAVLGDVIIPRISTGKEGYTVALCDPKWFSLCSSMDETAADRNCTVVKVRLTRKGKK